MLRLGRATGDDATNLRIAVFPDDPWGSGHYRIIWPAHALLAMGLPISIGHVSSSRPENESSIVDACREIEADVVVLQRPLSKQIADLVLLLQEKGIAVVIDNDDHVATISPLNEYYALARPDLSPSRNWIHLARACQQADFITVSTPALAGPPYFNHRRYRVIPNYVPNRILVMGNLETIEYSKPTLGWTGVVATHPHDLEEAREGILAVVPKYYRLAVVGIGDGLRERLGLSFPIPSTGWLDTEVYLRATSRLDVGIVPLAQSAFNSAKSWLKGLEFASLGIPFVASPTPSYELLHRLGAGLLAATPSDWMRLLRQLVTDHDLQERVRSSGYHAAEAHN